MPKADHYTDLTLPDKVREIADHHHGRRPRHISADEVEILYRAADVLEQEPAG